MHCSHARHSHPSPRWAHARSSRWHGRGRGGARAKRGDIRAAVLALLAEKPAHGYEMIKELDERTEGAWRPSPGSIYPTLQLLEDEGLIKGTDDAGKRRFELTDEGREVQDERSGPSPWEEVTAGAPPEELQLWRTAQQLRAAVGQVVYAGTDEQRQRVRDLLDKTKREIYAILSEEG
jgi:DNA-binding PadR family transcriptional regulator